VTYQSYTIIARRSDGTLFGDTVTSDRPYADFKEIYRHSGSYDIIAAIPGSEPYTELAKTHLGIETLECRASDDLDFHEVSYHAVKNALRDAYYRGFDAGREPRETRHHDCPFCGKQWREYADDDNYPNYCPGCGKELRKEA
jgi:hypothetical protein